MATTMAAVEPTGIRRSSGRSTGSWSVSPGLVDDPGQAEEVDAAPVDVAASADGLIAVLTDDGSVIIAGRAFQLPDDAVDIAL